MSVLLVAACGMVAVSWYVRNLRIFGPGVGLSTTSGITFYHGHNETTYGWHSVAGTDFEGLDDVARQELGYKLGWDYLKADPKRLLSDIVKGTKGLYLPHRFNYAVLFSMMTPKTFREIMSGADCDIWPLLSRLWFVRVLAFLFYVGLFLTAMLSIFFYKRYSGEMWVMLLGIIVMNWVCFAIVFWGCERYRFTTDVVLCILAGIALSKLINFALKRKKMARNEA
jgi:hypothetical protein